MNPALVVVRPFAAYGRGTVITDPKEAARVLGDERAANVVRVALPDATVAETPLAAPPPGASPPTAQPTNKVAKEG